MVKKSQTTPAPVPPPAPAANPGESGTPQKPPQSRLRASEVVIIITIIFACLICVLLIIGFIALVKSFPAWWHNLFGLILPVSTVV